MTDTVSSSVLTPSRPATAGDYIQLMKPRIMSLVVFTALAGLVMAPGELHPVMAAIVILAVALGSGAAGAINMWYDADIDEVMSRTATRPIPAGLVPPGEALALGLIVSGVSVLLMWMASNALAALLLALSIVYYGVIYTMLLKRRTAQNIVIGGGAGAFPPVIGWAAVTGSAPLDAWLLFAIIFFWTPPHFWALSLLAHRDYEKAGVPMLPVTRGVKATRRHILAYTLILVPVVLWPLATGLGGMAYGVMAVLLSGIFLYQAVRVALSQAGESTAPPEDQKRARNMFAFSILFLFALFAVLMAEQGLGFYVSAADVLR